MDWKKNERYYSRLRHFTKVLARMRLNGELNYRQLCNVYGDFKEKQPELKVKRLLRSETVQNMITEELINLTEQHGITAERSLKMRKTVLNGAIKSKNWSAANTALDAFDEKLDLRASKQITTQTSEISYVELLEGHKTKQLKKGQSVKEAQEAKQIEENTKNKEKAGNE